MKKQPRYNPNYWPNPAPRALPPEPNQPDKLYKWAREIKQIKPYSTSKTLPILICTLVTVSDGRMSLTWLSDSKRGDGWQHNHAELLGIRGTCNICLPTKTLRDVIGLMDGYQITITQDDKTLTAIITADNTTVKILGIDAQEFPPEPITAAPVCDVAWLGKACQTDKQNRYDNPLRVIHGNLATDGQRAHYDRSLPPQPGFYADGIYTECMRQLIQVVETGPCTVDLAPSATKTLVSACKVAKQHKVNLTISVNGRMDISAQDADGWTYSNAITYGYQHLGQDMTIRINPALVMDAISAKEPTRIIILSDHNAVFFGQAAHEAIIMPPGKEEPEAAPAAEAETIPAPEVEPITAPETISADNVEWAEDTRPYETIITAPAQPEPGSTPLADSARLLSSGTLGALTGYHEYSIIDRIHEDFITWCSTQMDQQQTWQAAWQTYLTVRHWPNSAPAQPEPEAI